MLICLWGCFRYTKEALDVSAKLLESNPEYYTAWNYRKLAVQHNLNLPEVENNEETVKSILDEELRLVSCFFFFWIKMISF